MNYEIKTVLQSDNVFLFRLQTFDSSTTVDEVVDGFHTRNVVDAIVNFVE